MGRVLYWLSGVAFLVEPFRWWARARRRNQAKQAALVLAARQRTLEDARLAEAQARAAKASQEAWAVYDDRQRRGAASRPAVCGHCHRINAPGAASCEHCGAPVGAPA